MAKKESMLFVKEGAVSCPEGKSLYTINDVAKIINVHQQTLRNWERKNVVVPLRAGTRRIYTPAHLELCKKIKEFSGKGVSLKGIKEIINIRRAQ